MKGHGRTNAVRGVLRNAGIAQSESVGDDRIKGMTVLKRVMRCGDFVGGSARDLCATPTKELRREMTVLKGTRVKAFLLIFESA